MKPEAAIQQECVMWFRNTHCTKMSEPRCQIFSVPNETKNVRELMTKKATGLLPGASDLVVILPGKVLFMECKDEKGRQRENQKDFERAVRELGHDYEIFRSLEQFQSLIKYHMK